MTLTLVKDIERELSFPYRTPHSLPSLLALERDLGLEGGGGGGGHGTTATQQEGGHEEGTACWGYMFPHTSLF